MSPKTPTWPLGRIAGPDRPAFRDANLSLILREAALQRERQLNVVRVAVLGILCLVSIYNHLTFSSQEVFIADQTIVALGLVGSWALWRWLARPSPGPRVHHLAVLLDLSMVVGISLAHALLGMGAAENVVGAQFDALFSFFFVVAATSAMRFSRRVARFGTAASGAAVLACFIFDTAIVGIPFSVVNFVIKFFAVLASGYIGYLVILKSRDLIVRVVAQEVENARVMHAFSRYVSREVAEEILNCDMEVMTGTRRQVTILFSDVRGFTAMSEGMDPEAVVSVLNGYFGAMVQAIFDDGGTVDKYIGDGIMAIFGAPVAYEDHALRAVRAAIGMREALGRLNEQRVALGEMPLKIGIGIHTGECVIGNIGSLERLDYTAIGDTVNTASRIEGLTKDFEVDILISGATLSYVAGRVATRAMAPAYVKGKTMKLEVHYLEGLVPDLVAP